MRLEYLPSSAKAGHVQLNIAVSSLKSTISMRSMCSRSCKFLSCPKRSICRVWTSWRLSACFGGCLIARFLPDRDFCSIFVVLCNGCQKRRVLRPLKKVIARGASDSTYLRFIYPRRDLRRWSARVCLPAHEVSGCTCNAPWTSWLRLCSERSRLVVILSRSSHGKFRLLI